MTKRNKKITVGSVWNSSHMQVTLKEGLDNTLFLIWGCGPQSSSSGEPHLRESLSNPQSSQETSHLCHIVSKVKQEVTHLTLNVAAWSTWQTFLDNSKCKEGEPTLGRSHFMAFFGSGSSGMPMDFCSAGKAGSSNRSPDFKHASRSFLKSWSLNLTGFSMEPSPGVSSPVPIASMGECLTPDNKVRTADA